MTPQRHNGAPSAGRPQVPLARAWGAVVDGLAALGTMLIGVLMFIICADIVARNALGSSLPLVSELGALLLVMIVALQLATTIRANRLARTEIFIVPLEARRPRAAAVLNAAFNATGAYLVGLIAWATVGTLQKDWASGEFIGTPGIGTLPTWPFRALILVGMTVAALELLFRAIDALRSLAARPEPRP